MKTTIIFGSILAGFLLLMTPVVNSIEYNQVQKTQKANIPEYIDEFKGIIHSSNFRLGAVILLANKMIKVIKSYSATYDDCENLQQDWCNIIEYAIAIIFIPPISIILLFAAGIILSQAYRIQCEWAIKVNNGEYEQPFRELCQSCASK